MSYKVKIPTVGESISEVTIATWLKQDGQTVKMDEPIAELESDKATFELTAPQDGIIKILKLKGDTVPIDTVVCEIATNVKESIEQPSKTSKVVEEKTSNDQPGKTSNSSKSKEIVEIKVPTVGESISEVTISSWLKKDGDFVNMDEIIVELESDKATFELPSQASGILRIMAKESAVLKIGETICKIEATDAPQSQPMKVSTEVISESNQSENYALGHPSPSAEKILAEKGIPNSAIKGSGVGGRITKEDALKAQVPTKPSEIKDSASDAALPNKVARGEHSEKMTSLRKTIAKRLVAVKNETAMLTTFNEVDMKPVMTLRNKYKEAFKEKYGVGLGFMSFFTRAICLAVKDFPAINASIDNDQIIYHDYCDVSIAVSTKRGLVVPVIRNAESLSFEQIEKEVVRLATRGRDGKLSIDEMVGGTISITNGGVFGSMLSTPIINPPQSAILGLHNIVERPVVINGEIVIRPIMYVAMSYDHRIVDGRESVSFLYKVKEFLEDPGRMILGI